MAIFVVSIVNVCSALPMMTIFIVITGRESTFSILFAGPFVIFPSLESVIRQEGILITRISRWCDAFNQSSGTSGDRHIVKFLLLDRGELFVIGFGKGASE